MEFQWEEIAPYVITGGVIAGVIAVALGVLFIVLVIWASKKK